MKRQLACLFALGLLIGACQTATTTRSSITPPAAPSPWVQVDLPGMHSGWRAAAYDSARDALWIVTRIPGMTDVVTLTRLNVADHSVFQTGLQLDATGWNGAWVLVDDNHKVWMAWGRTVFKYDPDTEALARYGLPPFEHFGLHPSFYSGDGNMVALGRDSSGELWTTYSRVAAIIGFNPTLGQWDRVVKLPWFTYYFTTIASPRPGVLTINGYRTPDDKVVFHKFAEVDVATGHVSDYAADVRGYALFDPHTVVFEDWSGNLDRLDLDTGEVTVLDGEAPNNANGAPFLVSGDGYVWYAMGTGIGKVRVTTGLMTRYLFPAIVFTSPVPNVCDRGPHGFGPCRYPCPSGVRQCIPKPVIPSAQINALAFDSKGNLWAVTELAGSHDPKNGDPHESGPMLPVMELKLGAG
jgi:hypothetical protein